MSAESDENKAVVLQFYAALNAGDVDVVLSLLAPDINWWTPGDFPEFGGYHDLAGLLETMAWVSAKFPDGIEVTLGPATAEDDRVAVVAESRGVHESGRLYNNHYHMLFVLRDGKITEVSEYNDTQHAYAVFFGDDRRQGSSSS